MLLAGAFTFQRIPDEFVNIDKQNSRDYHVYAVLIVILIGIVTKALEVYVCEHGV